MDTIKIPYLPTAILKSYEVPDRPGMFTQPVAPKIAHVPRDVYESWGLADADGRIADMEALQGKAEQWATSQEISNGL